MIKVLSTDDFYVSLLFDEEQGSAPNFSCEAKPFRSLIENYTDFMQFIKKIEIPKLVRRCFL